MKEEQRERGDPRMSDFEFDQFFAERGYSPGEEPQAFADWLANKSGRRIAGIALDLSGAVQADPLGATVMSVQEAYRTAKPVLASMVIRRAAGDGREWVHGGPDHWSKDELVARLVEMGVVSTG